MDLILGLVFFLCLMFLAMLFGERLSLFGVMDGRWLTAPFDVAAELWDLVCEAVDRLWCFVLDHFWWVAATSSGAIGVLMIALIMVSGLSNEAQAVRRDESGILNAGGVLDHTPILNAEQVISTNFTLTAEDPAISQLMYQVPSQDRIPIPASIRRPIVQDIPSERFPVPRYDVPPRETSPRYSQPEVSPVRLGLTLEPFVERVGRPVRSQDIARLIERTIHSLRNDDWMTFSESQYLSRSAPSEGLPEDSAAAVDSLQSRVRVIPGDLVSANSLLVEKSAPPESSSGDFDIEIRITNRSRTELNGLIVRELLPSSWKPVDMMPNGTYRDSTVTWLVDRLGPLAEEIVTLRVSPAESGLFQSYTEVSAAAAVQTSGRVRNAPRADTPLWDELPPLESDLPLDRNRSFDRSLPLDRNRPLGRELPPVEPAPTIERSRPVLRDAPPMERTRPLERTLPLEMRPELQLTLQNPNVSVELGRTVDVLFRVRNVGRVVAEGVSLKVELPYGLDHHTLTDADVIRSVNSRVARLQPGESRDMVLTVTPTARGRHFVIAELVLLDEQLDLRNFELVATSTDTVAPAPRLQPRPEFP